jgi:glutamate carboxypeptidase
MRVFIFCCTLTLAGQSLTPEQQKIVTAVNADADDSLKLLERIVNINSGTLNPAGVQKVAAVLRPRFEELGFTCRLIPMEEVHRAGHLVCERKGTHGKRVLLIGHMDTVFEPTSPFQKFERKGDIAVAPGSEDMKGGLVIILSSLKALNNVGALEGTKITVFLTGDEEKAGDPLSISRRDLIEAGVRQAGHEMASIARRSSYSWVLKTSGTTGHSAGVFGESGFGAIYELARILDAFRQDLREPDLTYNVGLITGGATASYDPSTASGTATGKSNIIPAAAQAVGDIRTVTDEQYARVRKKMREIVAKHLKGTSAEIEFKEGYPSMPATDANKALLTELNQVNRALGADVMEPYDPSRRGAGDLSFVAPYVASISGLGAFGSGGHAPGETIELKSQTPQARRVALFIYALTH